MFYPEGALKKGGRFYLAWVADSWPLRFSSITARQLWTQDIRNICDDLMSVVVTESGAPSRRFSLRLSSQLMRGVVRLYQRKAAVCLAELCMLNATVTKHVNKKFRASEEQAQVETLPQLPETITITELPEDEERLEEAIQGNSNVVARIDDITLKESDLPEVPVSIIDNFGETHPDQPLQLLSDRTIELMLGTDGSAMQQSIELPLDVSHSHDRTRLAVIDARMERLSDNVTMFDKSAGDQQLRISDITKEIPGIPDIPEIPLPAMPPPEIEKEKSDRVMEIEEVQAPAIELQKEPEDFVLEELQDVPSGAKKRRIKSKIIDKKIKLSSNYIRSRIENRFVELRCETACQDRVVVMVPVHVLLCGAARALGHSLSPMFVRNLGPVAGPTLAEREIELPMARLIERSHYQSVLDKIDEELEPQPRQMEPQVAITSDRMEPDVQLPDVTAPEINVPDVTVPEVILPEVMVTDISDLPTQVIETISQQTRKRTACSELEGSPITRRRATKSLSERQGKPASSIESVTEYELNKENIPSNIQDASGMVTVDSLLQDAGRPDAGPRPPREGSETPLGSLDRTKVSLGDSVHTTESTRFIRDNWGTRGTMLKILCCIKEGQRPLDVRALVARGPALPPRMNIVVARCFTSILKLYRYGFIRLQKDPVTLEITDIMLGPKFDND